MIVRRVPPKVTRAGGFRQLARYVTAAMVPGQGEAGRAGDGVAAGSGGRRGPQGARGLGAYLGDQVRHGDRVVWVRITNCALADDLEAAIKVMDATQAMNTRVKADANYHLVVAFPPGEQPERQQIEAIEDRLVGGLGLSAHQRISALHGDKEHLHLHVAINLIHPETFKAAHFFRDHERLAVMAAELEVEHGLTRTNHGLPEPGRARELDAAATMRAHTGEEPFIDWVKRVAGPDLLEAGREDRGGWPALHVAAARHGLEVRPRGAGLVIGKRGEPALMMRASDLDRSMSFGRLTDRLGVYQPAGAAVAAIVPESIYERTVRPEHRGEPGLWDRYVVERDGARAGRREAVEAQIAAERAYRAKIAAHYAAKFGEIKRLKVTIGIDPRIRYDALKREQRALLDRHRRESLAVRERIRAEHPPTPGWPDWLRREAEGGDRVALAALRQTAEQQGRREQVVALMIRVPERLVEPKPTLGVQARVGRHGDRTWRMWDGGVVLDTKEGVALVTLSPEAARLALDLAHRRADGAPLEIGADDRLRSSLLEAAVTNRMEIRFADPVLEAERDQRIRALDEAEGWTAPDRRAGTIMMFASHRNAWPEPGDQCFYRGLEPEDRGAVQFVGTMRLRGADIALWQQGSLIMVQDISEHRMPLVRTLAPGQEIDLAAVHRAAAREADMTSEIDRSDGAGSETERGHEAEPERDLGFEMD
ncbi:relaxase/mobilization nuclease family protein (plasmid) [Acidiphilium multivorum AIU301]|uniref:Relaxase/mobilization nuclease family protein n=1 Tax=Acidiphilium multivorum (strain DSM 11245 / JCM 8867 / NBRC 100883 / AIU 301) TaxID=926570 RepID=F0J844_ACIMA|nr:TraI/MobA(P) family conjugative relaxase [Acidiphilium multivorum]BAJ83261.1 relaxase/mobilization nuclease family protein [Acidiphilium multivorum AIU301]GAN72840.1 relaxase/mobilization nuclease [Acidiphilium multivorum AIU301]